MTRLPGELGHSSHLTVLGTLSPSGGLSVPPGWLGSGPCPERTLSAPHWTKLVPQQWLPPFDPHSILVAFGSLGCTY